MVEHPQQTFVGNYASGPGARCLTRYQEAAEGCVRMAELVQPAVEFDMPALDELVVSPAAGRPFRFRSDLGAGVFSGRAVPMEFVVIPPGVRTWGVLETGSTLHLLGISADRVRQCLALEDDARIDFGRLHAQRSRDALVSQGMELLWQEMERDDATSRLFVDTIIVTLLARLVRLAGTEPGIEAPSRGGLARRSRTRVIDYMHANLAKPVTLRELAAVAGLSPCHFARAFRVSLGTPPHRYLAELRLEHACELLATTECSVTEVASAVGTSSQHLVRCFRRRLGTTPGAYRRSVRDTH